MSAPTGRFAASVESSENTSTGRPIKRKGPQSQYVGQSMQPASLPSGVVQLGWSVMAPSQQVQLGAAHASALLESEKERLGQRGGQPRQKVNQEAALAQLQKLEHSLEVQQPA